MTQKLRKELHFTIDQMKKLQAKADKAQRSLKNYMEVVLISDINKSRVKN